MSKITAIPGKRYLVRFLGNKLDKAWSEPRECIVRKPFKISDLLEFTSVVPVRFYYPDSKYSNYYEIIQELGE